MFSFRDLDPLFDLYILKVEPIKTRPKLQAKQGTRPIWVPGKGTGRIGHVWDLQISELASKKGGLCFAVFNTYLANG